jgi:hypothetical protein
VSPFFQIHECTGSRRGLRRSSDAKFHSSVAWGRNMTPQMKRWVPRPASVLVGVLLTLLACGEQVAEPEIHLIPDGYMGDVFIIHDDPKGQPAAREGLSRVYRIPATGILRSQTSMNFGWGRSRYFYVTPSGERRLIEGFWPSSIHDTPQNRADRSFGIFFPRTGRMSSFDRPCEVRFEQYYVGTKPYLISRKAGLDEQRFDAVVKQQEVCSKPQ